MQTLAAGGLDETLKLQRAQAFAHLARASDHVAPGDAGTRIEIEHQPVGVFEMRDARAANVQFQCAGLCERDQPRQVFDRNRFFAVRLRHRRQPFFFDAG
jgi:hypothetical protein